MIRRAAICVAIFLLSALNLYADEITADQPIMELLAGKIILYPGRMGMTGSETLLESLQALPVLVQKGDTDLLNNYTIEENGNTYLLDPLVYLQQTRISEVDHIEIVTDGSVSNGISGAMGIINVVLKAPEPGTHVRTDIMANTNGEFYPTAYLSYNKNRFYAIGSAMLLFDRVKTDEYNYSGSNLIKQNHLFTKYRDEVIKGLFVWDLPSDIILIRLSQYYGKDSTDNNYFTFDESSTTLTADLTENSRKLCATVDYYHTFANGMIFKVITGIENITEDSESTNYFSSDNETTAQTLNSLDDMYASTTNWSATLKVEKAFGDVAYLKVAVPMSWADKHSRYYQLEQFDEDKLLYKQKIETKNDSYNPYFLLDIKCGKSWKINLGARELITRYKMNQTGFDPWSMTKSAAVYTSTVEYCPKHNQTLQVNYRHTATMPTVAQLYPNLWFAQSPNIYYKGNADLRPAEYDIFNVRYALNLRNLQFATSVQYYLNYDNIVSELYPSADNIEQWQSVNSDREQVFNLNASSVWVCGKFQLMSSVSVYSKKDKLHYKTNWCCLRLVPTLQLPYQFSLSAQLSYVSPQLNETSKIDNTWYGLIRLAKRWNNGLSAFVYWDNFFFHNQVTYTRDSLPVLKTVTKEHENKVSFGLSYYFK